MTHLYFQLLNHLHLDSTLSSAAVIQGVLIVQVPKGDRKRTRTQLFLENKSFDTNKIKSTKIKELLVTIC